MIRKKVTIKNITGLHLKPVAYFCKVAAKYDCKITFSFEDTVADAKSVLSVLGACVRYGDEIELRCDGVDEKEAMKAMVKAVQEGLGEGIC